MVELAWRMVAGGSSYGSAFSSACEWSDAAAAGSLVSSVSVFFRRLCRLRCYNKHWVIVRVAESFAFFPLLLNILKEESEAGGFTPLTLGSTLGSGLEPVFQADLYKGVGNAAITCY